MSTSEAKRGTLGAQPAADFFKQWERITNTQSSARMAPHLIEAINKVHPTLQQQMIALMLNLLNGIETKHADARNDASNVVVKALQEKITELWKEQKVRTDKDGYIAFPLI